MARKLPSLVCRRANLIRTMVAAACENSSSPASLDAVLQAAVAERSRLQAALDRLAGWTH